MSSTSRGPPIRSAQALLVIPIPTLSRLAAELPGFDLRFQLRRRAVSLISGRLVHVQPRVVGDVEAAEVSESKWPHRPVETFLDSRIDVLEARDSGVEQAVGLLGRGAQDAVDDEPS